jgi:hypothetical protein
MPVIPEFIYLGKMYFMNPDKKETICDFASSIYEA